MANNNFVSKRVFLKNVRLDWPKLDEPKADFGGEPKYQATFIMTPDSESAQNTMAAIKEVAAQFFGDRAREVMVGNAVPLHKGDAGKDGYDGMVYIKAKSKNRPELVGAKPTQKYTEALEIRNDFRPGNYVNAYITVFAYDKGSRGVAAMLDAVQFRSAGESLMGGGSFDFPDESGSAGAASFDFEDDTPF